MATCEGQCRACESSRGALRREVSSGLAGARHRPRAQRQIISAKPEPRAESNHTSRARALYDTPLSRLRGRVALPKGGRRQLFRYENDNARKFVWQVARVALVEQQRRERAAKCQPEVVGRSPAAAKARCGKAWPECALSLELFLSPAPESYRPRKSAHTHTHPQMAPQTEAGRPAKRAKLLMGDDDDASSSAGEEVAFKINEEFARRFEYNKKREEKQRRMFPLPRPILRCTNIFQSRGKVRQRQNRRRRLRRRIVRLRR